MRVWTKRVRSPPPRAFPIANRQSKTAPRPPSARRRAHPCMGLDDLGFYVRVILLSDGETLLNAFRDSNFTRKRKR